MGRKKTPMRKCVACQEMMPKKSLLRVVRSPEGEVKLDESSKASGRGAYICPTQACFSLAQKKKALEKSLKTKIDESVYDDLSYQLSQLEMEQS